MLCTTALLLALGWLFPELIGRSRLAAQPPADAPELPPQVRAFVTPLTIEPVDSELLKKQKERHTSAVKLLEGRVDEYKRGIRDFSAVFEAARFVAEVKLELADTDQKKVAVLEETLELAKLIEQRLQQQLDKGFGSQTDLEQARYARLSVEAEILKAKQKAGDNR
jgi:outer membrane protein TolC